MLTDTEIFLESAFKPTQCNCRKSAIAKFTSKSFDNIKLQPNKQLNICNDDSHINIVEHEINVHGTLEFKPAKIFTKNFIFQ